MIGRTYVNRHNGRTITIDSSEITDDGMIMYTATDANGSTSYVTDWGLGKHWLIEEEE